MRVRLIIGGLLLPVWLFSLGADVVSLAAELPKGGISARYVGAVATRYAFWVILAYPVVYVAALIAALWIKEKGKDAVATRVATLPLLVPFLPFVLSWFGLMLLPLAIYFGYEWKKKA